MPDQTFSAAAPFIHGKFLRRGSDRFFVRAMRISHDGNDLDFRAKLELRLHFTRLHAAHTNTLLVEGVHAETLIDLAAGTGLDVVLELNLPAAALAAEPAFRETLDCICRTVRHYRNCHSVIGFLLALDGRSEVAPTLLDESRGVARAARSLQRLLDTLHLHSGGRFVTVRHTPSTLHLIGPHEDLLWCALAPRDALAAVIPALQKRAETRPLIVEFTTAEHDYAERIAVAFQTGAAGVLCPVYGPPTGAEALQLRCLQPLEQLPFAASACGPTPHPRAPMVSVVVCAFDAGRTLRQCLESLRGLNYPRYEVIVVDDGSTDETPNIAASFAEFRIIRQTHAGLGAARNTGARAARGEIIAFTDADCLADPDWLTLLVNTINTGSFDLCGGPNYAPEEDSRTAACVAAAPGAPCPVLTADNQAEHLSGCNLALRAAALAQLGGFDPQFLGAGDDVDICWRALEAGMRIGFSPAAFVWHHRRNTITAYYRQQHGYGRAETMLYRKYPERFNALGQIAWRGIIPGLEHMLPVGAKAPELQLDGAAVCACEPPPSLLWFLPQSLEWNAIALMVGAILGSAGLSALPALAMFALSLCWALYWGWHARLQPSCRGAAARLLLAWLAATGPLVRAVGRYRESFSVYRRAGARIACTPRQRPRWRGRRLALAYCNQASLSRDCLLARVGEVLRHNALTAKTSSGWDDYDVEVRPAALARARIKTADEEYEGSYRRNLVEISVGATPLAATALGLSLALTAALRVGGHPAGAPLAAIASMLLAVLILAEAFTIARQAYLAVEHSARQLGLEPMGRRISAKTGRHLAEDTPCDCPAVAQPPGRERNRSVLQHFV